MFKNRQLEKNKKIKEKGVTLVELLVAMTIFSLVLGVSISLLETGIRIQRQILKMEALSDNVSYVMEYMSRTIRMAKKDKEGGYITAGCNFENPGGDISRVQFLNSDMEEQEFLLENGQLKEIKEFSGIATALTSSNFEITKLHFHLLGACQNDDLQPRVTIAMEIRTKEANPQTLNIQTTVSQRDLDVAY